MSHSIWYAKILSIFLLFIWKLQANEALTTFGVAPSTKSNSENEIYFDDGILRDMATKMDVLRLAHENLRIKFDTIKQSLEVQPQLITEQIKALLPNLTLTKESLCAAVNTTGSVFSTAAIQRFPTSCEEALHEGTNLSGIYEIYIPYSGLPSFKVYCLKDPEQRSAWTIIQRRQDGSTNFYRDWQSYKDGFGFLDEEFFLGLQKIYAITNYKKHELWVKLEDFEGEIRTANYKLFAVGSESEKYALNVLGKYSGTGGDSLRNGFGMKFTTRDSHNDNAKTNCAISYVGAWWYNNCHESNLNGLYLGGAHPNRDFAKGVEWKTWHEYYYSLRYVHMAIRPV